MANTETITAPRKTWTSVLEVAHQMDMSTGEHVVSVAVVAADYETKPFLALRLKLLEAVQSCFDDEDLKKIDSGKDEVEEATAEVELTIAEVTYLDVLIQVVAFKGALTLKRDVWRAISNLCTKHQREKEA